MKRIVFILVLSLLLGACERKKDTVIRMETSLGNIRLKLYDETVLHRDNILKLIREGYYNGRSEERYAFSSGNKGFYDSDR